MAPRVLSSGLVFISSANRLTGTPDDFTLTLPNNTFHNPYHGRTKVVVVDCIINRCFYSVREINNKFSIHHNITDTTSDFAIPHGNYTIQSWLGTISGLLGPNWKVSHDPISGLCTYSTEQLGIFTWQFNQRCAHLFGFNLGETQYATSTSPLKSRFPLKLNLDSFVNVHTDLPRMFNSSIANYRQKEFRENDVLCRLPVNVVAWGNIVYQNQHDDFSFYLAGTQVNTMRLYLTSEYFDSLDPFAYDWSITLRVDYESPDDSEEIIIAKMDVLNDKLQYLALK